jgi:hypothetical protein
MVSATINSRLILILLIANFLSLSPAKQGIAFTASLFSAWKFFPTSNYAKVTRQLAQCIFRDAGSDAGLLLPAIQFGEKVREAG